MVPSTEPDIFRDTNVRYLGYANEVGESFRSVIPLKLVRLSYGVAFAYVFADTADKSWKSFRRGGKFTKVVQDTGDALIWQTLASIIIPGFTINRICTFTNRGLIKYVPKLSPALRSTITVGIGLASIPIIVGPIDKGVDLFMDATYRRWCKV